MKEEDFLFYKKVLKPRLKEGFLMVRCEDTDRLITEGEDTKEEVKKIKNENKKNKKQ